MQNGEQLGTDPPPSLAKKKKEKRWDYKKNYQKRNRSQQKQKKTAGPKQGNTKHVADTHTLKSIQPRGFKQKSGVSRTVTALE